MTRWTIIKGRTEAARKGCPLPGAVAMSTLQGKSSPAFLWELQGPVRGLRGELRSFGGGRELAQGFQASSKKTEFFISRYEVLC